MKQSSIILIAVLALSVGLILGYAIWGSPSTHSIMMGTSRDDLVPSGMHRMPDGSLMHNTPSTEDMGMMGGMDHSMMMVTSERAFLKGMIPHHQEAIDTAKEVLARGGSTPEMKTLAENIITAQEKEIALMKSWYQAWYGEPYQMDESDYQPMMRDLSPLQGAALDRVFLEDMIMHHMGAVMMAKSVQPYITHQEITDLTNAIITTQTEEIQLMKTLLKTL